MKKTCAVMALMVAIAVSIAYTGYSDWVDEAVALYAILHPVYTNIDYTLSWAGARMLDGFLELYAATGDTRWLERFHALADRVIETRADCGWLSWKGIADEATSPACKLVHTGLLLWPIARYVYLAHEEVLPAYAVRIAKAYEPWIVETWLIMQEGYSGGEYWFPDDPSYRYPNADCPENQRAICGIATYWTWKAMEIQTASTVLAEIADLNLDTYDLVGDRYVWDYWESDAVSVGEYCDKTSYAGWMARFVQLCAADGIVFSSTDVERMENTFENAKISDGDYYNLIDESTNGGANITSWTWVCPDAVAAWWPYQDLDEQAESGAATIASYFLAAAILANQ